MYSLLLCNPQVPRNIVQKIIELCPLIVENIKNGLIRFAQHVTRKQHISSGSARTFEDPGTDRFQARAELSQKFLPKK
jgi:hypothetical protein